MNMLRIVGDVHGQLDRESLFKRNAKPYLELIASVSHSIQIGDMGDGETYDQLIAQIDPAQHRFFPGNHDHYDRLPPHCLGDYGSLCLNHVDCYFIRGAASTDRAKLLRRGKELGKRLWFSEEELSEDRMLAVEADFLRVRPHIVLTHEAPTQISRYIWRYVRQQTLSPGNSDFLPSRTSQFLDRLLGQHPPKIWLFGHHHHDWQHQESGTLFVCVGELSCVDIDSTGKLH